MLKYILLLIFTFSFSNAESLYNGMCIDDFYLKNSRLYFKVSGAKSYSNTSFNTTQFNILMNSVDKYEYTNNNICVYKSIDKYFGMTETQFNFMSALTGLLTAFLIVSAIQKRL